MNYFNEDDYVKFNIEGKEILCKRKDKNNDEIDECYDMLQNIHKEIIYHESILAGKKKIYKLIKEHLHKVSEVEEEREYTDSLKKNTPEGVLQQETE